MEVDDLYQEVILDHFKKPRCHGCLAGPCAGCTIYNPLCGDQIVLNLRLSDKVVSEIAFSGHGCSISQAAASMMTDLCRGKTVEQARTLAQQFRELMRGERKSEDSPELGDAISLEGVRNFSSRVKCATLAWEALDRCLDNAEKSEQAEVKE